MLNYMCVCAGEVDRAPRVKKLQKKMVRLYGEDVMETGLPALPALHRRRCLPKITLTDA